MSLYKRKNGYYYTHFSIKRRQVHRKLHTKDYNEALRLEAKLKADLFKAIELGELSRFMNITISELIIQYQRQSEINQKKSKDTDNSRFKVFNSFFKPLTHIKSIKICSSVKGAINNIENARSAKTDEETKQALYGLGGNSAEFVDSAIALYSGTKGLKAALSAVSQVDDYAKIMAETVDDIPENMKDLLNKAKTGSLSNDELEVLKEFLDRKENLKDFDPQKGTLITKLLGWSIYGEIPT